MNSQMFQLQTGQYLCVFISHEKYVSIINTEFANFYRATPTKFFPSESEIIFTNDEHTILRRLSFIFALFESFLIANFHVLRDCMFKVGPIMYVNFVL